MLSVVSNRCAIVSTLGLCIALSALYYVHELLPKPLRALTSILESPTAIASGVSYYLNLGIEVYDSPLAVVLSNLFASGVLVLIVRYLILKRSKKTVNNTKKDL